VANVVVISIVVYVRKVGFKWHFHSGWRGTLQVFNIKNTMHYTLSAVRVLDDFCQQNDWWNSCRWDLVCCSNTCSDWWPSGPVLQCMAKCSTSMLQPNETGSDWLSLVGAVFFSAWKVLLQQHTGFSFGKPCFTWNNRGKSRPFRDKLLAGPDLTGGRPGAQFT